MFDSAYRERPPWDIGAPQPDLVSLLDEFPPAGPVLDIGCGTGELSISIARRGLEVLGVDFAEAAIVQARAKAAAAGPEIERLVEFRVGDALRPSAFEGPFGAVVDSGFFHIFGESEREQLTRELAASLAPRGRYYLLGFAFNSPMPNAPREVREDELRTLFAPDKGWRILALRPAHFVTRSTRGDVPATAACMERT